MKPLRESAAPASRAFSPTRELDTASAAQAIASEWSASASEQTDIEVPPEGLSAPADRSKPFVLHVAAGVRIISDDLQWIIQTRKGKANAKNSGWRSRGFCRSRIGLQLALRRMFGRDGVPAEVVRLVSGLPEWHQP